MATELSDTVMSELPTLPNVPWSFSALEKFEACPKQYGEVNVKKAYPFVPSEAMDHGNKVHKLLENYLMFGEALPPNLQRIGRMIDVLSKGAEEVIGEKEVAFTNYLKPCGFFHQDISYRGKVDATFIRPDAIVLFDYKTGKPYGGTDQLEFMCVALLLERPKVNKVFARFVYTKYPDLQIKVTRDDIPRILHAMVPRLARLKEARDLGQYPATPGPQCTWCPVTACKFHPKRS